MCLGRVYVCAFAITCAHESAAALEVAVIAVQAACAYKVSIAICHTIPLQKQLESHCGCNQALL